MKTATIIYYRIRGTRNSRECLVQYRGETLKAFDNCNTPGFDPLPVVARKWALENGFTHTKFIDETK